MTDLSHWPRRMTVKQVANELNCSNKTVYRCLKDGRIRGYKGPGGWRVKREDLKDYIDHLERDYTRRW